MAHTCETDPRLNPNDGRFSVLASIKGGRSWQAIVSENEGANWLGIDSILATLMSDLQSAGRFSKPLYSDACVTNDSWHRIGFTWDGSSRRLYVDGVLVAESVDVGLACGQGGLTIGCDRGMTAGSFFTGLIDDVRVYNRAVEP